MQRVVLVLAAEHLDGALQFRFPADKRVVVGDGVVETYHLCPPCFLMARFTLTTLSHGGIGILILANDLRHQFFDFTIHRLLEHITCLRLIEAQQCLDQMGHVELLGARTEHLIVGDGHQLIGLCRGGEFIIAFAWHALHAGKESVDILAETFQSVGIEVSDSLGKRLLSEEGGEDVLRSDKLMSAAAALLHRIAEHQVGIVAMF